MRKRAFSRYERDAEGRILIDVAASRAEDLYNDFDKNAPYVRRDLDQDLVDYLIKCARELGDEPFTIQFTLAHPPDEARSCRIRRSVENFFLYLVEAERHSVHQMIRRSSVLLAVGVGLLFLSVWGHRWLGSDLGVVTNVLSEGVTIAAWVSMWEALASFLIDWFPRHRDIVLYRRLAAVEPVFRAMASPGERTD